MAVRVKSRSHRVTLLALVLAIGLYLGASILYGNDHFDDPFITYRYSRNLARGHGLVWNVGERPVEGYTNFLWAVVHAPFIKLGVYPLLVSKVLTVLAGLLVILFLFSPWNGLVRSTRWRLTWAVLFSLCPVLQFYGQSGMETLFFADFVLLGVGLWLSAHQSRQRTMMRTASLCFGIAALTRPEGVMIFSLAWLLEAASWRADRSSIERRNNSLIDLAAPWVCLWLPYFLWKLWYYGYPFPNTYYAKHSNTLQNLPLGVIYVGSAFSRYLVAPLCFVFGIHAASKVRGAEPAASVEDSFPTQALAVLLGVFIVFVILVGGDDTAAFPSFRLLAPILPALFLLLVVIAERATSEANRRSAQTLALSILGMNLVSWAPEAATMLRIANGSVVADWRSGKNAHALQWKIQPPRNAAPPDAESTLIASLPPDALIATSSAGRLPYYADRPVLDMLGLNDVHIAHVRPIQKGIDVKMDPDYVLARRPALIIVNVKPGYVLGKCSFEDAAGYRLGDRILLDKLKHDADYEFVAVSEVHSDFLRKSLDVNGNPHSSSQ